MTLTLSKGTLTHTSSVYIPPLWMRLLGGSGNDRVQGCVADTSGNFIVTGYSTTSFPSLTHAVTAKYNTFGVLQWQRQIDGANGAQAGDVGADASDNIYVTGRARTGGSPIGEYNIFIAKYNSSGVQQWQRILGDAGSPIGTNEGRSIAVDPSGNCYVAGVTSGDTLILAKYNSSGTLQWQRGLLGFITYFECITVDPFGDVLLVAGTSDILIAKYNSSGTLQWQKRFADAGVEYGLGIDTDSSGNIYIGGYTYSNGAGGADMLVAKYNSSMVLQWQKVLGSGSGEYGNVVAVDSSGNVYQAGRVGSTPGSKLVATKHNTSGTLQWQRYITVGGSNNIFGVGIDVDDVGSVFISGYSDLGGQGDYDYFIAKVPDDGSDTGGWNGYTYYASALSSATSSLTTSDTSFSQPTMNFTDSSGFISESTGILVETVIV